MSGLQSQMRHRDREMVPLVLVRAMFALMIGSVLLVAYARLTDRPKEGVLIEAPVVAERLLFLSGDRNGVYEVRDESGAVIARSSDDRAGFIGVIGRVLDRRRQVRGVVGEQPVRVVRRENGHIAVIDDSTGLVVELIGYGPDNVAAFAQFVN
jgi:putative photosynthetic complex assembly protein